MYIELLLVLCASTLIAAGGLQQSLPVAYNSALPANYYAPILTKTAHHAPEPSYSYNALAYQPAPVYKNVVAAPLIAKHVASPIPVPVQYAAAPLPVPVQHAAPLPVPVQHSAPLPVPVQYAAPLPVPVQHAAPLPVPVQHSAPLPVPVQYSAPVSYPAPNYASYVQAKNLAVPAVAYPEVTALKSAVTYSAAPAVSHVSFNGLGVNYSW